MKRIAEDEAAGSTVSHDSSLSKKVYLKSGDVPGVLQWASSEIGPGLTVTPHNHPDATELFQILEGEMEATVDCNRVTLGKGSLLVIEPGETHSFENTGTEPCRFVYTLLQTGARTT